jgi:spermidine synthase
MPTPPKTDNPLLLSGIALAMTSAVTVVLTLYVESKERFWLKRCGPVIHERQSAFSHIRVREKDHVRSLMFVRPKGGEGLQTSIDLHAPSELQLDYTRYMFASFLHRQAQDQVLIVGLGGGGMVRFLNTHFPNTQVDAVEIDPVVVDVAAEFFETHSGPKTRIITEDAFAFFKREGGDLYDVIYMDAFLKPSGDTDTDGAPQRLRTVAFFKSLKQRLKPGGVVTFNVIENDQTQNDLQAIREAFGDDVMVYRAKRTRNLVIITSAPPEQAMRKRGEALDERLKVKFSFADLVDRWQVDY